jgi:hypothetical protein
MKFRDETRYESVDHEIDGVTHPVRRKVTERVPVLPRDWDAIATRVAVGVVLMLTAVAVTWSTVSIGGLLGGGVGYAAATVFDLSWLTVLLLEWLSRFDAGKRQFPRRAGWLLVVLAAGAIGWHGAIEGSLPLAVVGALVSVIGKLLWLAVFKHIDREIGEDDAAWMSAEISRINAQEAIAGVRLRAAAAEERSVIRLLQAERMRAELASLRVPKTDPDALVAAAIEHAPDVSGQGDEHARDMSGQAEEHESYVALTSADSVRTRDSVASLARLQVEAGATDGEAVSAIIAARPDTSPDTALRSIRRARKALVATDNGQGGYL